MVCRTHQHFKLKYKSYDNSGRSEFNYIVCGKIFDKIKTLSRLILHYQLQIKEKIL